MDQRSDDFSSLLAALSKGNSNPPVISSFQPPSLPGNYNWQPVPAGSFPNVYPQPQFIAPVPKVAAVSSNTKNWIIGALVIAVVAFGAIAWLQSIRVVKEDESSDEEEEDEYLKNKKKSTREIPPPATVRFADMDDLEADKVSRNIFNFVKEYADEEIDLSGEELPMSYRPEVKATKEVSHKKIVADESQEVLDYAKKRESLFSATNRED